MSIFSSDHSDKQPEDRRCGVIFKRVFLLVLLLFTATSNSNAALPPRTELIKYFVAGLALKVALGNLIDDVSSVVWPVSKHQKSLQGSPQEKLADAERPVIIRSVNAALQIASKMMIQDALRVAGVDAVAVNFLANAFDAGIKSPSVYKFLEGAGFPLASQVVDFLMQLQRAVELADFLPTQPSAYRYSLNQPLYVNQGTASSCGAQDVYCLQSCSYDTSTALKPSEQKMLLADQAVALGSSFLLTAAGYKLADAAFHIGTLLSPLAPAALSQRELIGQVAASYLQKVGQRFSEIQFGEIFVRALAKLLVAARAELIENYKALPEEQINNPIAQAKIARDTKNSLLQNIQKGVLAVIGCKVSLPTEIEFVKALLADR